MPGCFQTKELSRVCNNPFSIPHCPTPLFNVAVIKIIGSFCLVIFIGLISSSGMGLGAKLPCWLMEEEIVFI
jgi:hypothetical protein